MKLVYCKMPRGNFGDDLNEWLWERVAPGLVDEDAAAHLIGIGTIIQRKYLDPIPAGSDVVIIGAGAGSKGALPHPTDRWRLYGVRGPLTASYYELGPDKVLTDPAIFAGEFTDLFASERGRGIGFMPHIWTVWDWDWRAACEKLGLIYIDPEADSKETIRAISGLDRLVTEAMHGAIVADALRVPWLATSISPRFEPSKWCDWAGSLGVDMHFHGLPQLTVDKRSLRDRIKTPVKNFVAHFGYAPNYAVPEGSTAIHEKLAQQALRQMANEAKFQLSAEHRTRAAIERFREALHRLTADKQAGRLSG